MYSELGQQSDGIVSIHVSGDMTGTVRTARLAAERSTRVSIRVLESRTATMAEGFVVLAALRAAAAGATLEQVVAEAERVIGKVDFLPP